MSESRIIRDDLLDQFNRSINMLYAVFDNIPSEKWTSGITETRVTSMIAYHVVETLDFYFSGKTDDQFQWGYRFRGPWWETPRENLPTKEEIVTYLREVEARVKEFFKGKDDDALLEDFKLYGWSGETMLGHLVYALRHAMHHQGELTAFQLYFGVGRDTWR